MSQHDLEIANQGFPATRADINNALQALGSLSSGATEPATTYANQLWYDTANNIIKIRNEDNDAWISLFTLDQAGDLVTRFDVDNIRIDGTLDLLDDDGSASIRFQAPSTVTSTTTFTLPDGDGDSGQTLVTNGSGTLAWAAPYGNRNLVINGAMQVAQRGTSVTGVTSGAYRTCDRFMFSPFAAGTWTVTQSTDAPDGFSNSFRIDCTTADASLGASDFVIFETKLEAQNLQHLMYGSSSAKSVTASFYVKSNKTGTYVLELRQPDSGRLYNKTYTIDAANTWEYKTLTFPGDVSGTINNDNGEGLNMNFWVAAGSTYSSGSIGTSWHTTNANRAAGVVNLADSTANDWAITGVQLEVGAATPFEHRSYADELARCQRYYIENTVCSSQADMDGANYMSARGFFPVSMRAVPTISNIAIQASGNMNTGATLNSTQASTEGVSIFSLASGAGNTYVYYNFDASAEL